ncbi:galactose oxidase-like domain-containing protein [Chlorogloea sp. CCALA 695]|uniref:galactose oxidase-like domain-containing protein n=1 Tax=Chlorogloea sp. CCALA 695 TaxID=2107693 RepID=UPI000D04B80F|nr:galactose oxidase-like domain-containing protein [Chlorogloea sp. CCALA 695]PSB31260.1 hypothetical protein C7B70_13840 [Chlorogloea sp. CCALA 695]
MNNKASRLLLTATTLIAFENFYFILPLKAHNVDACIDVLQEEAQIVATGTSKREIKRKLKDEYKELEKECDHGLEEAGLITLKQVRKDKAIANLVLSGQIAQDDLSSTKKKSKQDDLAEREARMQRIRKEICATPAPEEEYACPKSKQETLNSQAPASKALAGKLAQLTDPIAAGEWQDSLDWPLVAVHMAVGPNGKVLAWTRPKLSLGNPPQYTLWNPDTHTFTNSPPFGQPGALLTDIFCAGHDFAPSGKLLVAGGHSTGTAGDGSRDINVYDFITNTWNSYPNKMNSGRWYPTVTYNGSGEGVIVGGSITGSTLNTISQVWEAGGTQSLRTLSSAVLGLPVNPYAWNFVAPSGRIFNSGPTQTTRALDTTGTGKWSTISNSKFGNRYYGSSLMYGDGKVLIVGGSHDKYGPPTKTSEVVELFTSSNWIPVFPMQFARRHHNATLLPDEKVLVTGGTSSGSFNNTTGAVLAAEMWDPQTTQWTTVASMKKRRTYHSTAVLLPDGRVVLAGGGLPIGSGAADDPLTKQGNYDAEIYSPPYLFKGTRPVITSAPANVSYNQTFTIQTPDAASISKVTWIRLSSTTHQFNAGQRISRLNFTPAAGGLFIETPTKINLNPPGYYMLFILNGEGVPSVAKIIQIT